MSSSIHNLNTLREAAITLLREVESLASQPGLAGLRRDDALHAGRFQC